MRRALSDKMARDDWIILLRMTKGSYGKLWNKQELKCYVKILLDVLLIVIASWEKYEIQVLFDMLVNMYI